MSSELNAILRDLAGYLEQQQQAGGLFYLEEEAPGEPVQDAPAPVAEAPAAPVAAMTTEPAIPAVRTPAMKIRKPTTAIATDS